MGVHVLQKSMSRQSLEKEKAVDADCPAPGRLDWIFSEGLSLLSAYAGDSESTVDPWAVSDT